MSEIAAEAWSDIRSSLDAWADELAIESLPFEPAEPIEEAPEPSSGSRVTLPCPPPAFEEDPPPTSRCPTSAPHTDRPVVIDIVSNG